MVQLNESNVGTHDEPTTDQDDISNRKRHDDVPAWKRMLLVVSAILAAFIIVAGGTIGYLYASTPLSIRQPLYEHYHYRMQVIVNGKPVNFAAAAFQEGYSKDNCNALLTTHPIHFHDDKDQFVHIHWEGMTGGQVLKYYGWNFIGGTKGSLGYRFDTFPKLHKVPIHGSDLPAIPDGAQFYIYTGDQSGYKARQFSDFTSQDLEKFFGTVSNSPAHNINKQKRSGLAGLFSPKVYAHEADSASDAAAETSTPSTTALDADDLRRLNNLIGNVVIFVQKDKPSDVQVKDRFNHLEPLSTSTCAG